MSYRTGTANRVDADDVAEQGPDQRVLGPLVLGVLEGTLKRLECLWWEAEKGSRVAIV